MKFYYLWKLRQANKRLRDALDKMLPGPCPEVDDPSFKPWAVGAVNYLLAANKVEYYRKKLETK